MAKDFAKELCRRFVISRDKVHVSIVSYSQYVHIMPKFSDCYDEKSLENALNNQHLYEASSTSTGRTLKVIYFDVFNEKRGGARTEELGEQLSSSLSFIHFMLQQCLLYSPVHTNVMQRRNSNRRTFVANKISLKFHSFFRNLLFTFRRGQFCDWRKHECLKTWLEPNLHNIYSTVHNFGDIC